jgi:hemoglobin
MRARSTNAIAIAVALWTLAGTVRTATPAEPPKSLYDRLGGLYNIAAVVDDFIDRVYENATLNANPNIAKARSEVRKAGLKVHLANQVCMATGGPCKYTGMDMNTSHAGFKITEKEWAALAADFKATLDAFKVPDAEQKELFAIVESTKGDIVVGAAAPK